MSEPFGGMQFSHSLLLVLCNRLTTCLISLITIAVRPSALTTACCKQSRHNPTRRSADACSSAGSEDQRLIYMQVKGQDPRPQAPLYAYAAVSLSNVVATTRRCGTSHSRCRRWQSARR